ncbi:MAG: outer membrane protein assembly factor BamD [Candidatus Omnitrophica bacterium]|nr:outer membrane protein assembly factor BamD [Candidatus Omnitrophota bacterium]
MKIRALLSGKIFICLCAFLFLLLLLQNKGRAEDDKKLYYQGVAAVRKNNIDFAFLYFHKLLNDFPDSRYREKALFATGEYYFSSLAYRDASGIFYRMFEEYPESKSSPFVLAYLIKIAQKNGDEETVKKLEKELIASQQVSLLFRDFKELQYSSAMSKKYKALYFIDKIEIYIDNELFAQIPF